MQKFVKPPTRTVRCMLHDTGHTMTKHNVTEAVNATLGIVVLDAKSVQDGLHNSSSTALGLTEKRSVIECVASTALRAEIQQACNIDDELFAARLLWSEINGYHATKQNVTDAAKATPGFIVLYAKGVYDA